MEIINRTEPFRLHEPCGTLVQVIRKVTVVRDVADQEESRRRERADHAIAMREFIAAFNKNKTGREQDDAQTVEAGFKIIMKDPNVKAILINIFGGIVRCDRVASGVIEAYKNLGNINIPIIVRLQGTNAVEAKKLIDESGLKVQSAIQLSEAADLVKKAVA